MQPSRACFIISGLPQSTANARFGICRYTITTAYTHTFRDRKLTITDRSPPPKQLANNALLHVT
jgi:hypothetical protein